MLKNIALDHAKGLAIITVVFAHVWRGLAGAGLLQPLFSSSTISGVSSACTLICIPLFFFVSGLLYGDTGQKKYGLLSVGKKFDALIYPYIIWGILVGGASVLASGLTNKSAQWSDLYTLLWQPHGIFWFIYALFLSFLVTNAVISTVGLRPTKFLILLIAVCLLTVDRRSFTYFAFPEFCLSYIYFALGFVLCPYLSRPPHPSFFKALVSVALAAAVLYYYHVLAAQRNGSPNSVTPDAAPAAVFTVMALVVFAYSLPRTGMNWLATLGQHSMDIYLMHLLVIAPLRIAMQKGMGVESVVIYVVGELALGLMVPVAMGRFLRRHGLGVLFQPPVALSLKKRFQE